MKKISEFDLLCICCHANNWIFHVNLPRFLFGINAKILVCRECGCGTTIPQPKLNMDHYEQNNDYVKLFTTRRTIYKLFAEQTLGILESVRTKNTNKSLLDVGCGGGFLVDLAKTSGYNAKGLEANHKIVEWANHQGIPVYQGDILSPPPNISQKYDFIVLSSVLEHLDNPEKLLELYRDFLSDDGVIFVSQTNYRGLLPRVFPWGWYGWQPKEHYWHFTQKSMKRFTERIGYKCVLSKKYSLYHPWFTKGSVVELIGRNLSAIIAKIGVLLKREDGFCILLMKTDL